MALVGTWKLISYHLIYDQEEPKDIFGPHPKGSLIVTRTGRMMGLLTADPRRFGRTEAEQAALHRSMIAYTGTYRVEGNEFVTTVDASWNEAWTGTEQRRRYTLEGDTLTIVSEPQPSTTFPGKVGYAKLVWKREREADGTAAVTRGSVAPVGTKR